MLKLEMRGRETLKCRLTTERQNCVTFSDCPTEIERNTRAAMHLNGLATPQRSRGHGGGGVMGKARRWGPLRAKCRRGGGAAVTTPSQTGPRTQKAGR